MDIIIEQGFDFNVVDLFFIFKFYFKNSNCFIKSLYLCINTKEDSNTLFTYKKISIPNKKISSKKEGKRDIRLIEINEVISQDLSNNNINNIEIDRIDDDLN
jgi:hypothetical protein